MKHTLLGFFPHQIERQEKKDQNNIAPQSQAIGQEKTNWQQIGKNKEHN